MLDWSKFESLPGDKARNFDILCRGLIKVNYERYGSFRALSNQPGVEFHLKLNQDCALGSSGSWLGWQCKYHTRRIDGLLTSASKMKIKDSIIKTEKYLPDVTDWFLWTPYTLKKADQTWFYGLETSLELGLLNDEDVNNYLTGDALAMREIYFGELIITPEMLAEQHNEAVQPIKKRWLSSVHQKVDYERNIRQILGEPSSWEQLTTLGQRFERTEEILVGALDSLEGSTKEKVKCFIQECTEFKLTMLQFNDSLIEEDLEVIKQKLSDRTIKISAIIRSVPRLLRKNNLSIAVEVTNALDDMNNSQQLIKEIYERLNVGFVAVLADGGGGKTQIAAEISSPQSNGRPAGIFLHGHHLHKGKTLDDLSKYFSIHGKPVRSLEALLGALDAAAKRAVCRLPVFIDGLNEAENPKDWKSALCTLREKIKKYPNVLIICTLRTGEHKKNYGQNRHKGERDTFVKMTLPDNTLIFESNGFGEDLEGAVIKYFDHYKIEYYGNKKIPGILNHPLSLRLFCETTNPDQQSVVRIDHYPLSLSGLFDKYLASITERIVQFQNLTHSYNERGISDAIYYLGIELWKSKKRQIAEEKYKELVGDKSRNWESSIVNLFAQEGVIFRNHSDTPGLYVLKPIYDMLGGHIIANALLKKHSNDYSFSWLNEEEIQNYFLGENHHELSTDIFISLILLAPVVISGSQIWKNITGDLKSAALIHTTMLDATYLDNETVTALRELLVSSSRARQYIYKKQPAFVYTESHPLNASFLDSVLRELPVSKRDICFTEWVRVNSKEKKSEILRLEHNWKENLSMRDSKDKLTAIWIKWYLSSTDRDLRDYTTRALYWYGRGYPAGLFEECIDSISINDPYIPERMLAATYGVIIALYANTIESELEKQLEEYARKLFELMFSAEANYKTTHILLSDYAIRSIELINIIRPGCLTKKELAECNLKTGYHNWGGIKNQKGSLLSRDTPFHMDFENYTIGSLVRERGNYNFDNEKYCTIRSQILWRIEELGWSTDRFEKIDQIVSSSGSYYRSDSPQGRIDRYGKKYSWIAFYEMYGQVYADEPFLKQREIVDIDPTFPGRLNEGMIIEKDFLGKSSISMEEWISNGNSPDIKPYQKISGLLGEKSDWIILYGYFTQEDEIRGRSMFCFIRSLLVKNEELGKIVRHLEKQNMGGSWLPEKPSLYYTYGGEIPWSNTFPDYSQEDLTFSEKEVYECYTPVCDFNWESGHSVTNDSQHMTTLTKNMCDELKLSGQPQLPDLYSKDGSRVTISIEDNSKDHKNTQTLFYIKEDELIKFLSNNNLSLVWVSWGEREYSVDQINKLFNGPDRPAVPYKVFSTVDIFKP